MKRLGMPRWIMVLPLLHLLKGTSKPFEAPTSGNLKYGPAWAGLGGLDLSTLAYMNSQDKRCDSLFLCRHTVAHLPEHLHLSGTNGSLLLGNLCLLMFQGASKGDEKSQPLNGGGRALNSILLVPDVT